MKEIRLALTILKTLIKNHVQYSGRLLVDTLAIVCRCGITLLLYWYVFKTNKGEVNGTSFLLVAWSMFFYFSFMLLRLRDTSKLIMEDIRSGNIEVLFSKPINYIFYRVCWQVGSGIYSFGVITLLTSVVLACLIGIPETMTIGIFVPTLILAFIGGIVLALLIYLVVGLLSFWIEDITPIYWIVDKTIMILGGSYLPIALFPPLMYKISLYSPFGAAYFVTHTVYESWQTVWLKLIGIQWGWIILLGLIVYFMFKSAKQKVSVNGG